MQELTPPRQPQPPPSSATHHHLHHPHNIVDTLTTLLKASTLTLTLLHQLHAHLLRHSLHHNPTLATTLLTLYSTLATPLHSLRFFFTIPSPSLPIFNAAIRALSRTNPSSLLLYRQMTHSHILPDNHTFPFLLISCSTLGSLPHGKEVHSRILKLGFLPFLHVGNALIDMYGKFGELGFSRKVFLEMPNRDVVSCNAVLGAHAKLGTEMELARKVFEEMPERNLISWNAMVVGYVRGDDLKSARELFERMRERNLVSWNMMVVGYVKNGMVDLARELFDEMPERNLVSWAAVISGYAQSGRPNEALEIFREMEGLKFVPDAAVMVGVISSAAQLGGSELADWVGSYVERMRIERNVRILTALVDMHVKCGNVEEACCVFEEIPSKDVMSYTALINGLASHGHGVDALELFGRMQAENIEPDGITFIGVLNACRHAGLVKEGLRLWDKMVKCHRIRPESDHYACIGDLLGRAGRLAEAHELIRSMPSGPHAGALGAVLAACRSYGEVGTAEAVAKELFELEPENTGNYILLWSLYASKGQWDKATSLRQLMNEKGIQKIPGYSCV